MQTLLGPQLRPRIVVRTMVTPTQPRGATVLEGPRAAALASHQNHAVWAESSAGGSFSHVFYSASCFYTFLLLREKKRKFTYKCVCVCTCTCFSVCFLIFPSCSELGKRMAQLGFSPEPPHHTYKGPLPGGDTEESPCFCSHFSYLTVDTWPANLPTSGSLGHCVRWWQILTITLDGSWGRHENS